MLVCGIDPGKKGAFVFLSLSEENPVFKHFPMPLHNDEVHYKGIRELLLQPDLQPDHIYLERAMPMAMGSKHAFNYGRGFAALEIAIQVVYLPVTYVEPSKWTKALFEGIDSRLKPKERSIIAGERLLPAFVEKIPRNKNGRLDEGVLDALLIAYYGLKKSN